MKILAIDLGKSKSVVRVHEGKEKAERLKAIATTPQAFHDLLAEEEAERVLIEIGPAAGWVCDLCRGLGVEVKVANTSGEAWRWRGRKNKSDRLDTARLLGLELSGQLETVHVPEASVRQWRQLIGYRREVVGKITGCKNRIRGILDTQAVALAGGDRAWGEAGRQRLEELCRELKETGDEELWRGMVKLELEQMDLLVKELEMVEERLAQRAKQDERVERLQSVPGVGPRVAEAVVALVDDAGRFKRGRQVGSWAGLTPRRFQSGQMELEGHISHCGSAHLRQLLIQACWSGVRQGGWMRDTFERISGGKKRRRRVAIVACARQLLVRLWAMLRDGTRWREPEAEMAAAG